MKYIKSVIVVIFVLMQVNTANAQWVVAAPMTDALTMYKNIKDSVFQAWNQISSEYNWATKLFNDGQMLYNQTMQIKNQYDQITQMATALQGLDTSSLMNLKNSLQDNYNKTNNLFQQLKGMDDDTAKIQAKFEASYPTLNAMAKLDPQGWKSIVDTTSQEQRDNIYNAKIRAANIAEQNKELQKKIEDLSDKNASVQGIKETAQLGNDIALQQQQLLLETNNNLALMLKQQADNYNHLQMLQQAMQLEASKSFAYTPATTTVDGPGLFQVK